MSARQNDSKNIQEEKFGDFLKDKVFLIPDYQRSYAWEKEQLEAFISDLKQNEEYYFYGMYLLRKSQNSQSFKVFDVIDGQQRLTTAMIFLSVAKARLKKIFSEVGELPRLTLQDNGDAPTDDTVFQNLLKNEDSKEQPVTLAQKRLIEAKEFFETYCENSLDENLGELVGRLLNAKIWRKEVNPNEEAQIFELMNSRGKPLTTLEKLKAYLLRIIGAKQKTVEKVVNDFSEINKSFNKIETYKNSPTEDEILGYFLQGNKNQLSSLDEGYWLRPLRTIKDYLENIKKTLPVESLENQVQLLQEIKNLTEGLKESFSACESILEKRLANEHLAAPFIVSQPALWWPLFIKIEISNKKSNIGDQDFKKITEISAQVAFGLSFGGKSVKTECLLDLATNDKNPDELKRKLREKNMVGI